MAHALSRRLGRSEATPTQAYIALAAARGFADEAARLRSSAIYALLDEGATQTQVAEAAHLTQARVSQIAQQHPAKVAEPLTPQQIMDSFAAGFITREQLIAELAHAEWGTVIVPQYGVDDVAVSTDPDFSAVVGAAARQGIIDETTYNAIDEAIEAHRKG